MSTPGNHDREPRRPEAFVVIDHFISAPERTSLDSGVRLAVFQRADNSKTETLIHLQSLKDAAGLRVDIGRLWNRARREVNRRADPAAPWLRADQSLTRFGSEMAGMSGGLATFCTPEAAQQFLLHLSHRPRVGRVRQSADDCLSELVGPVGLFAVAERLREDPTMPLSPGMTERNVRLPYENDEDGRKLKALYARLPGGPGVPARIREIVANVRLGTAVQGPALAIMDDFSSDLLALALRFQMRPAGLRNAIFNTARTGEENFSVWSRILYHVHLWGEFLGRHGMDRPILEMKDRLQKSESRVAELESMLAKLAPMRAGCESMRVEYQSNLAKVKSLVEVVESNKVKSESRLLELEQMKAELEFALQRTRGLFNPSNN